MSHVALYGVTRQHSSMAVVTKGFQEALDGAGVLAGTVALEDDYLDERHPFVGAPVAIMTGPLSASGMIYPTHRLRMAMIAPNSDKIPRGLANVLQHTYQTILVPSHWAKGVLDQECPGSQVLVVPHGISAAMRPDPELRQQARQQYEDGVFRVLHFSTSDRQRKGSLELLQAWSLLVRDRSIPRRSELVMVMDKEARVRLLEDAAFFGVSLESVSMVSRLGDGLGAPAEEMRNVLCSAHVVCQPSRGEGFGMVPLEARACGVPVVATLVTGHSEHMQSTTAGVVPIHTGGMAPIDDLPGARAPSLSYRDLAESLLAAYMRWESIEQESLAHAEAVGVEWSWHRQLAGLVSHVQATMR